MKKNKASKLDRAVAESRGETATPDPVDAAKRETARAAVPEGYQEQTTADVVGYWQPTMDAIHFVPIEARLIDSHLDKTKSSTLVIGRLVAGMGLVTADGVLVEGAVDSIVGVWAKPGMRALAQLCGVPVYMYFDGTKDVGKPSPMALFCVLARAKGTALPVASDTRTHSRATKDALGLVPLPDKP